MIHCHFYLYQGMNELNQSINHYLYHVVSFLCVCIVYEYLVLYKKYSLIHIFNIYSHPSKKNTIHFKYKTSNMKLSNMYYKHTYIYIHTHTYTYTRTNKQTNTQTHTNKDLSHQLHWADALYLIHAFHTVSTQSMVHSIQGRDEL